MYELSSSQDQDDSLPVAIIAFLLGTSGSQWLYQWFSMVTSGSQWLPVVLSGSQ